MEDRIKAFTEELNSLRAKEAEAEKHLAELKAANVEKIAAERDGGIKLRPSKSRTFIAAKTARETAETTSAFKNHVAKIIDDTAKEGMTQVIYFIGDICDAQVNAVVTELADLGYDVDLSGETQELIIKW
jgi:hypothetical protein